MKMVYKVYKDGRVNIQGQKFAFHKMNGAIYRTYFSPIKEAIPFKEAPPYRYINARKADIIYVLVKTIPDRNVTTTQVSLTGGEINSKNFVIGGDYGNGTIILEYYDTYPSAKSFDSNTSNDADVLYQMYHSQTLNYDPANSTLLFKISMLIDIVCVYVMDADYTLKGKTIEQIEKDIHNAIEDNREALDNNVDMIHFNRVMCDYTLSEAMVAYKEDDMILYNYDE